MRFSRIKAVSRKEFIHIIRDPRSLGMAIAIPMLLLILFGYALTLDVDNVPLVIWDQSDTPQSRSFISNYAASEYFSLRRHVSSYDEIENALDTGSAVMGIVIPRDFAEGLSAGERVNVQIIVDGSDSNTATIATGYAEALTGNYSRNIAMRVMQRRSGRVVTEPIDMRPRVWYNPDLESRNYIVPGLIAVIMMVIAALLTSLTISREWESGTMEQLISTPIKTPELITGKLIPYFIIGMIDVAIAVIMGKFLFEVPLRGSPALLFGMAAIFLAGSLGLGITISIITKNQLLASQAAMVLTFLPSFLLSGFMYAIANMPHSIQIITYIIPARYFVALLKGIYLKGIGLNILFLEASLLLIFAAVILIIANLKFRKKLV